MDRPWANIGDPDQRQIVVSLGSGIVSIFDWTHCFYMLELHLILKLRQFLCQTIEYFNIIKLQYKNCRAYTKHYSS